MKIIDKVLKNGKTRKHFELTGREFQELDDESAGLCLACGETNYGVEPDADGYECENCESHRVVGVQNLLVMDRIDIVKDADSDIDQAQIEDLIFGNSAT